MGNCFSCIKVSSPPTVNDQITEQKDEVELHSSFMHNSFQTFSNNTAEAQSNGNKKPSSMMSTFNGTNSDNYNFDSFNQNNLRSSRGFCARLQPIARMGANSSFSSSNDKHQKEPSEYKINALFDEYKDPHEDTILEDGIERLCEDLQLKPDDFQILVFAWKLKADQMCRFTRTEFFGGLKGMKVDSISGIQSRLPEIVDELKSDVKLFKDLYRFTFRFGLDVASGQRILPADMAIVLWRLVFSIKEPTLLERWLSFLECCHVRGIPRDTWNMFLNFVESIGDDLGAYDDAEAWPSLFDDFVEYENDQMNQNFVKDELKSSTTEKN